MTAIARETIRIGTLIISLLLLVAAAPTSAREDDVKIPFLFSEDDKLAQTDLREAVPRSNALAADQYLNAPMTRLDYMLMMLEARLNEALHRTPILSRVSTSFEPREMTNATKLPTTINAINGYARYDRQIGHIFVGYTVRELGRPRRPMRATCDEILSDVKFIAPQELLGFLYHNTVLGVLDEQKHLSEYSPPLELLAKSVVHRVTLESSTEHLRVVHGLTCQRSEKNAPVLYHRFSFKLK